MGAEFDRHAAKGYDGGIGDPLKSAFGKTQDNFLRIKAEGLARFLSTQASPSAGAFSLLDFGCGTGQFLSIVRELCPGAALTGCDVSEGMLKTGQAPADAKLVATREGERLPFADASFHVATAVCVFHHIPPAARAFAVGEIRRTLKPGGLFFLFEHNPWNPLTVWVVKRAPIDADAILLSAPRARELMTRAGLPVIARDFLLHLPPRTPALRRADRFLRGLPLGAQYMIVGRK